MHRSAILILAAVVALLTSCSTGAMDASRFAATPAFVMPSLSPDGQRFSSVQQRDGAWIVAVRTLVDGHERRFTLTSNQLERIRWCGWSDARHLLCGTILPSRMPDRIIERTHLHVIDVRKGEKRELTLRTTSNVADDVIDLMPSVADKVLLQHDVLGRGYPQVSEVNVATGQMRTVQRSHAQVRRWMSDGRGVVRLGVGFENGRGLLFVSDSPDDWRLLSARALNDIEAFSPLAFGPNTSDLYVLKHHEGRAAVFSIDLADAQARPKLVFADDVYDVTGPLILEPTARTALAVQYPVDYLTRAFLNDAEQERYALIEKLLPSVQLRIVDRALAGDRYLVEAWSDSNPPSLYIYDESSNQVALIGHQYPELETLDHAPMQPVRYRARDGQVIPGYLTIPTGGSDRDLPAIVMPHGGPETRVVRGFDPLVQLLAAEGYAVLQMNYRGSFGFGVGFAAAGAGQWGGVIHNDITDGTRWLVEQEIADPERICIVGQSFGGFAALLGAARESQWYACAASFAGFGDLLALSQSNERSRYAELWRERLGASNRALWENSPLARAKSFEVPVMLMHGTRDAVVPVNQSRRMARVLRDANKAVQFIERDDCDHDMITQSCRVAFFNELASFLRAHLHRLSE